MEASSLTTDHRPLTTSPTLARQHGARGLAIAGLLAVSLGCNVTAMVVPFLEIEIFLKGKDTYSLPHSVQLMWESGLYVIAALIVGFSILFPFVKLGLLAGIWFVMRRDEPRRKLLERIEPLGKWSFLDIFIVCIILILTNQQVFISATPIIGVYFFVTAIVLSMAAAAAMEHLSRPPAAEADGPRESLAATPGWQGWVLPPMLVMSVPALLAALEFPFLKISQFLLRGHDYSIVHSTVALWEQRAYLLGVMVALTLIAMPALTLVTLLIVWFARLDGRGRLRGRRLLVTFSQWAMLDVFGLALLVFLTEGDQLIKTDVKQGLYLIVGAIVVLTLTGALVGRANRRAILQGPRIAGANDQ